MGAIGGLAGRIGANRMSNAAKEKLGEEISLVRTWARGDKTLSTKKTREYMPNQKYTYPDQRTSKQLVEAKFGLWAKLSDRQKDAYRLLLNYRVDHTLPKDIGVLLGLPAANFGILTYDDPRHQPQ